MTAQCGEEKAQEHLICMYKYLTRVKEAETDFSQWCTVPGLEKIGRKLKYRRLLSNLPKYFAVRVDAQGGQRAFYLQVQNPPGPSPEQSVHTSCLEWTGGQEVPVLQECL